MSASPNPQPASVEAMTPAQRREIEGSYDIAMHVLNHDQLCHWLRAQPTSRIVGQPRSAMSCLLATYLFDTTKHLWCVSKERFWRFDLVPPLAWLLPAWAITLAQVELQMDVPLTAADGLYLLRSRKGSD